MFSRIIFLIALSLYILLPSSSYAESISQSIKEPLIKPNGGFYYIVKRGYEKILEKFQFSDNSKLNYRQNLLITRLSELKYVAERKDIGELQQSTERFSYEAGKVGQLAEKLSSSDKTSVQNKFKEYQPVLEQLRDLYVYDSSYWKLIQYDIDTLDILSKKLKT